jgi:putative IMPACT (imprinted ancient) family translation regulator
VQIPQTTLRVEAPMALVGAVYHAVSKCTRVSEEFTADSIVMTVTAETAQISDVMSHITDATRGAATTTIV